MKNPITAKEPVVKAFFEHIDANGLKMWDIAQESGIAQNIISNWRKDAHRPRVDLFAAACEAAGLKLTLEKLE